MIKVQVAVLAVFAVVVACAVAQPHRIARSSGSELPEDSVRSAVAQLANARNSREYSFSYDLADGTHREEKASLRNAGTPEESLLVEGLYLEPMIEGLAMQTKYSMDENGLQTHKSLYDLGAALTASLIGK